MSNSDLDGDKKSANQQLELQTMESLVCFNLCFPFYLKHMIIHTYIYIYILSKIECSSPRLPLNLEGDYLRYQSKKGRKSTEDAIRFHEEVQKKTVSPRV